MAIKKGTKYHCGFCNAQYDRPQDADACKLSHNLVYIPFTATELNRLAGYIMTRNEKMYDDKVMDRLRRYMRQAVRLDKEGS